MVDAGTPPSVDNWLTLEYPLTDYAGKTVGIVVTVSYGGEVKALNEEAFFDEISVVGVPLTSADEPHGSTFDFETASRDVPKPREIWPIVKQHMVPLEFTIQLRRDRDAATRIPTSGFAR